MMIENRVTSWLGTMVIAGLISTCAPVAGAQTDAPTPPLEVPPAQQIPAGSVPTGPTTRPPQAIGTSQGYFQPAAPEQLPPELALDIEEELIEMVEDSPRASVASLRPRLMSKAESMAAAGMGIPTAQLAQHPSIRRELRRIVRSVLPATTAREPASERTVVISKRESNDSGAYDRDRDGRCECAYCHSLHAAGTCALPYCQTPSLPTLPTLPTAASYAVAPYYVVPYPYAPRHHFLHGLFCPCSWCRGGW